MQPDAVLVQKERIQRILSEMCPDCQITFDTKREVIRFIVDHPRAGQLIRFWEERIPEEWWQQMSDEQIRDHLTRLSNYSI